MADNLHLRGIILLSLLGLLLCLRVILHIHIMGKQNKKILQELAFSYACCCRFRSITEEISLPNSFSSELAAENYALKKFLRKHNADVLIEPDYVHSKNSISVSGYPAKYKNFRNMEEKDIRLLETRPYTEKNIEKTVVVPVSTNKGLLGGNSPRLSSAGLPGWGK